MGIVRDRCKRFLNIYSGFILIHDKPLGSFLGIMKPERIIKVEDYLWIVQKSFGSPWT